MASTPTPTPTRAATTRPAQRRRPDDRRGGAPGGTATTASRSIRPPVAVPNWRLPLLGVGEAFLVYRCVDCGAVGQLRSFPDGCDGCGAGREALYYEIED
jgi:hypothetical protein